MPGSQFGDERQQSLPRLDEISLAHHRKRWPPRVADALHHGFVLGVPTQGFDDEHDDVGVHQGCTGRAVHRAVQRPLAPDMQPRRVDERDLGLRAMYQPDDAMARRLRTRRDDRELLADQGVQQRGLADIGSSDQGGKTGAERRRAFRRRTCRQVAHLCRRIVHRTSLAKPSSTC